MIFRHNHLKPAHNERMVITMVKRITVLFITILLIIPLFSACAQSTGTDEVTTAVETKPDTELVYSADNIPDFDFNGYTFRMVTVSEDVYSLTLAANATEERGEVVNDAIYKRNRIIEDRYNMVFKQLDVAAYDKLTSAFKTAVTAASDDFDLCLVICRDAFSVALDGMVLPVSELPYVDITKPWYAHDVNDALSIGGKLYFAYSDECLNMFEQSLLTVYNKKTADDYNLPDIYQLVYDGSWTIDKFFEMAQAVATDLDGNGKMTDTDLFGAISELDMFYPSFWIGADFKTVMKDANDLPYFNGLNNEKFNSILNKVFDYVNGGDQIYFDAFVNKFENFPNSGGESLREAASAMFAAGNALFKITLIGHLSLLRDMKNDFGVIPLPKYDTEQKNYVTRVIDGWINIVPISCPDPERTSVIMESLAAESKNYTIPAYYEVALKYKYSRDEDTITMLDIIYNSRTMDLGDTVWMDPIRVIYTGLFQNKKNTFASSTEKSMNKIQSTIDRAIEAFRALN